MALCSMLFADRIRFTQDDELPRGRLCLDVVLTLVPAPVGRKAEYFDDRLHNTNQFLGPSNTISIMMIGIFHYRLHNTNRFLGPSNTISIMMDWGGWRCVDRPVTLLLSLYLPGRVLVKLTSPFISRYLFLPYFMHCFTFFFLASQALSNVYLRCLS